jgi:hypothetical protein
MKMLALPAGIVRLISIPVVSWMLIGAALAAPPPQEVCEAQLWDKPVEALMITAGQPRSARLRFESVLDRRRPAPLAPALHLIIPPRREQ